MNLQHPEAISSNKLRKHIATVTQILNLSKEESRQFSKFMGHTEKTHEEFYELPVDIYPTAKVSKILLMMQKGSLPVEYNGKSLSEINLDARFEYPEEDVKNRKENNKLSKINLDETLKGPEEKELANYQESNKVAEKNKAVTSGVEYPESASDSDEDVSLSKNKKQIQKKNVIHLSHNGQTCPICRTSLVGAGGDRLLQAFTSDVVSSRVLNQTTGPPSMETEYLRSNLNVLRQINEDIAELEEIEKIRLAEEEEYNMSILYSPQRNDCNSPHFKQLAKALLDNSDSDATDIVIRYHPSAIYVEGRNAGC